MSTVAAYWTDVGKRKQSNEDAFALRILSNGSTELLFAVICDGVGGFERGELASGTVAHAFAAWFDHEGERLARLGVKEDALFQEWNRLLRFNNDKIRRYGAEKSIPIGTTCTAMLLAFGRIYIAHVGDSRLYCGATAMKQLTKDHSLVQQKIDQGILTEREAKTDRQRNVLLRSVGTEIDLKPSFYAGACPPGYNYLLCSDGFYQRLSEQELAQSFSANALQGEGDAQSLLIRLTTEVKQRGETDNITAILFANTDSPAAQYATLDLSLAFYPLISAEYFGGKIN